MIYRQLTFPFYFQVFWITLGISQVVLTALWALPQVQKTRASIATNAVTAGGILLLCLLSYAEHIRSASPSFLLDTYLSSSLLFDVARTRTLWLRWVGWDGKAIAIVSSVMVGIKCLLLLLETMDKKSILRPEYQNYPPEATSGFFNKAFFLWLNPLFKKGFSSLMSVDDLFALDKQLESKRLEYTLESNWNMGNVTFLNAMIIFSIELTNDSGWEDKKFPAMGIHQSIQMATPIHCSSQGLPYCSQLLSASTIKQITFLLDRTSNQTLN